METITISAMVFIILIGAMIFNYFIVLTGIPNGLSELVTNLALLKLGALAVILFIYLLLGCIMDSFAMTVLTLPIFLPVLAYVGYDLIWFGVIIKTWKNEELCLFKVNRNSKRYTINYKDSKIVTCYSNCVALASAILIFTTVSTHPTTTWFTSFSKNTNFSFEISGFVFLNSPIPEPAISIAASLELPGSNLIGLL
jgi:hypothetical protein